MHFKFGLGATVAAVLATLPLTLAAQSANQQNMEEALAAERALNAAIQSGDVIDASETRQLPEASGPAALAVSTPGVGDDFIVLGYAQSYGSGTTYTDHYRWRGLTHIASTFITFDSNGNITNPSTWTGRDSHLLAGGGAEAAGVEVLMTVLNSGFDVSVINDVMTDAGKRSTLVDDIVGLLFADGYSHGVTFDFEPFSWSAGATTGMTSFFAELRADLDTAGLTNHSISLYADPTPNSTQWDLAGFTSNIDFYTYSCYDFATGSTPSAISRWDRDASTFDAVDNINDFYIAGGVPPEKIVATLSSYGRRWPNTTSYGVAGSSPTSTGFTDGLYDTTRTTANSGPHSNNYVDDDQVGWYTYNDGSDQTVTWECPEALEFEINNVVNNRDPSGVYNGRRLGGVGFWSMIWMAETSSYEVGAGSSSTKTRFYPHILQLCQEILAAPGDSTFTMTGFESLDFRWRDPNESSDSTNANAGTARAIVTSPAGSGAPANTTNALQLSFDFAAAAPQAALLHYEILADADSPSVPDTNNVVGVFDSTTAISCYVHAAAAYSGVTVRMLVVDADDEIEASDPFPISSGWQQITWDLTDSAQVNAYTTTEPLSNGDGTLDTAGGGARDIGFIGFLVEKSGAVASTGTLTFDELEYAHINPNGLDYKINEVRYNGSTTEFIEIYGPAGSFPANTQVRVFDNTDGSVLSTFALSGNVPGDGLWVIGDTGVANVDDTGDFSAGDDISDVGPIALQIYNTATGSVYDSLVLEAFGGMDDLVASSTLGVTAEGYPWVGRVAAGTDAAGEGHTAGRLPDGVDTDVNGDDFSLMKATPGVSNGTTSAISIPTTFDFSSAPVEGFQTFQSFAVTSSGVGSSPSGGNVHRCIDTSGGGVMSMLGNANLGSGSGYDVTGEIYIPGSGEPAQAIAIGFCVTQGSTFFTASRDDNSYEDGYWLIYENASGVGLDDGRADHAGTFEFVQASHDNQDANPVDLIGSETATNLGLTPATGAWTTFRLSVNPSGPSGQQLLAEINGNTVFLGDIPSDGPTQGAIGVGFRENHSGAPAATEGTWIDNFAVTSNVIPVELSVFETN